MSKFSDLYQLKKVKVWHENISACFLVEKKTAINVVPLHLSCGSTAQDCDPKFGRALTKKYCFIRCDLLYLIKRSWKNMKLHFDFQSKNEILTIFHTCPVAWQDKIAIQNLAGPSRKSTAL